MDAGVGPDVRRGPTRGTHVAGPIAPTSGALGKLRPLGLNEVTLSGGSALGDWQERNRSQTVPHCVERVVTSGAMGNLERLAEGVAGNARHEGMVFADSDVYKVVEAIAWESVRGMSDSGAAFLSRAVSAIERAQRADGYLHSWFQGEHPDLIWKDLRWGHELYCAGHLLQAAVAGERSGQIPGLRNVANKLVAHLLKTFSMQDGDGRLLSVGGHPQVETALVEHFRLTGDERALRLAARQIDLRGRPDVALSASGAIDHRPFVLSYFQHHLPIRSRKSATGHAVRELYLQSGVVDVATETGDRTLLAASEAIWQDLFATKTYLTGGHGSRHRDESIGDAYELPGDRAYAETCAGIASFQWNWRLLLATGQAKYAAAMERVLWNIIAGAISRAGTEFFYSNTLHLRSGHEHDDEDAPSHRLDWYACACCPPNLARLIASVQSYLVTRDQTGLQLQMPFSGVVTTAVPGGAAELEIAADHPFGGNVEIVVRHCTSVEPWTVALRLPEWTARQEISLRINGEIVAMRIEDNYARVTRRWLAQDTLRVEAAMPIRVVTPHPRIDAARGCVALERGPLVYCLEADDLEDGTLLEDVMLDVDEGCEPTTNLPSGLEGYGGVAIRASGWLSELPQRPLYGDRSRTTSVRPLALTFVPYFTRANRTSSAMRVWVPASEQPARPDGNGATGEGAGGSLPHSVQSAGEKGDD